MCFGALMFPMADDFSIRLNKILDRLTSDDFLEGRGLGNEIPFYAFDYPPEKELAVREHVSFLLSQLSKSHPELRVRHINLFDLIIKHLKDRNFYDKAMDIQVKDGDEALLKALSAPLNAGRLARVFAAEAAPESHDLVLVTGVGSSYPMLRTHNLLNNLHRFMEQTPLVLFFPGVYDGQTLKLFGLLKDNPYYRAFRLVD